VDTAGGRGGSDCLRNRHIGLNCHPRRVEVPETRMADLRRVFAVNSQDDAHGSRDFQIRQPQELAQEAPSSK
jgi:hypothetical protein